MKNKKLLISLLSLAMVSSFGAALTYTASATGDELAPQKGEFEMVPGAEARVNSVKESGIRFKTTLSKSWVDEIKSEYPNAELTFGTLIAPTKNIADDVENLTKETPEVEDIQHTVAFKDDETTTTLKASVTYDQDTLEADWEKLHGEISEEEAAELIEKTYDIELTARAYCSVVTSEKTYTYYAISNDNSRTARSVINAEIIDGALGEDDQDIIDKYIGSVEVATAYADLEGDVVFNQGTANRIYVGASSKDKILDDGYVQWAELVEGKTVGETLTVSTIVDGKITRINVSVIDEVMTDTGDLSLLNNTNAEGNTKTYALGKSLNAATVAMAHDNATGAGFGGLFDGMGHTIFNLNIGSGAGLFGEFVEGAIVQNLALYDITVNGGFYLAENNPKYTMKNVYVKLSEESKNPKGISKMTTTQVLQNVVVEYTGANAVKIPASANSTGWDKYGVLCYGLGFEGSDTTGRTAQDYYFEDVYVISPSHIIKGTLMGYYGYGKNETTDVWGGDIWNGNTGAIHQFGDGGDPTGGNCTKYLNVPFRNTYHYDGYSEMAKDENDLNSFDGKYWVKINNTVRWKDTYVDNIDVVVTDETDEEIDEYKLQTTTDKVKVSMVDMYGNVLDGVEYTIVNDDGILTIENGVISLNRTVEEDKDYTVAIKVVIEGITIERNITIKALAIRTTYTQEVYLATNSDYAGTDQYVLTDEVPTIPTDIVSASLNGVALTITDGKLPDISMDYIKKFESYGKTRQTYMNIYAGETSIVSEKADQTPLTLTIKTATETIEFTNLFVCTDVIQSATDLNRFKITYKADANERSVYANDGYYAMTNNIDAKDLAFAHNNNAYDPSRRFVGTFDGRGYTISNLNVDREKVAVTGNTEVYGLFGNLYGADILNVGFMNVSAEGGSVLGTHSSYVIGSYTSETGALTTSAHIYPAIHSTTYNYMSTRIENVYIKVADSVQSMQGALCSTMDDYNFLSNIVIEWNPTATAELSAGFGSFIGNGTLEDANKPKRENVVVLSSVKLNSAVETCSGVTVFANRAAMENDTNDHTTLLASFASYWTTESKSPVWKTADWQNNN